MASVNVNLLWTRRYRGLLPLAANALEASGALTFVRPDELEARTYQVMTAGEDGRPQPRATLSVETVSKMEVARSGAALIGVTDDDLYLFREERKTRFMPGRRVSYSDVALSREGSIFGTAFSDMMFSSHCAALCDLSGKAAWTKNLDFAVTRVAIAPDGRQLVVGGDQGKVAAFDALRSLLWEVQGDGPVAALALAGSIDRCLVGGADGSVRAVDAGSVAWRADAGLPVIQVALSDSGDLAAVAAGDASGALLLLLDREGTPAWEYALESRPTGLSLAPDGSRVAVSMADGTLALFELLRSEEGWGDGHVPVAELETAARLWEAGQRWEARGRMATLLRQSPGEVEACERLSVWDAQLVAEALAEAGRLAGEGEFAGAMACLDAAREAAPEDERIPAAWRTVARLASATLRQQAGERLQQGDLAGAMTAWEALVALCPKDRNAHAEIATARRRRAEELTRDGDARAAAGDEPGALALWRQAQALAPSEELAGRLRRAELQQVMARGMRLYQERRYPEAAFQFRKALALDPQNEEARRHLAYATDMRSGSPLEGRFTRLE